MAQSTAPREIEALIALMARLPGLGPRSARRAVLMLLKKRAGVMAPLGHALVDLAARAQDCESCGNISESALCPICSDPARDNGEICVLEDVADLWAMERAGVFAGRYHVLGGVLSPLDAVGPEELRLPALLERIEEGGIREVILALNATVDGQTTAHYIADLLAPSGVALSTLGRGVPIGGELDHLDDGTIGAALRGRRQL